MTWDWLKPGGKYLPLQWARSVFGRSDAGTLAAARLALGTVSAHWRRAAAIALALLLSAPAMAQDWSPGLPYVDEAPGFLAPERREFSWSSLSYSQTLIAANREDRLLVVGARIGARVPLPLGLWMAARADASALGDGETDPKPVDILKPDTYSTLEGHLALWGKVYGPVSAVAVFGAAAAIEAGGLAPSDRYPLSYGGGVRMDFGSAYALVMAGEHEASGDGLRLLFTAAVPLGGRTVALADGALGGDGSFARFGIGLILGGSQ